MDGSIRRAATPPRLLDQVRAQIRAQQYSAATEAAYVQWIRRFILFHENRRPLTMGGREVTAFLTHLATERRVSASTQNQALNALVFLYEQVLHRDVEVLGDFVRAQKPRHLPVVLSPLEPGTAHQGRRLRAARDPAAAGQGRKDRVTPLPEACAAPLEEHLGQVRERFELDLREGFIGVSLADALARNPNAGREWGWQWVLPASRRYADRAAVQHVRIDHRRLHAEAAACAARST